MEVSESKTTIFVMIIKCTLLDWYENIIFLDFLVYIHVFPDPGRP